jgi:hypothetical protein
VAASLEAQRLAVAGVRLDGVVRGQLRCEDLAGGGSAPCGTLMQPIAGSQLLDANAPLIDVFGVLTRHERCFVSAFDAVSGVIERDAVNKPVVRMWLFGVITLYEMGLVGLIRRSFAGDSWQAALPADRLQKARDLQQERQRRSQHSDLIDCLQFADKARLMLEHPPMVAALGLGSRRVGKQFVKELESLRNHLVHAQDIVSHDWAQIIRTTQRVAALTSD